MFTSSDALSPLRAATPFAASAIEGKRRRATLSDAENLAVGAFGGIVETCVQSASPSPTPRGVAKSDNLPAFSFIRPSHRARARLVLLILLRPRPPSDHHAVLLFVATSSSSSSSLPSPRAVPLITFKICVQSGKPLPSNVAGWYRGVVAAAAPIAPITAIQVAVNGAIERSVTGGVRDASSVERIGVAMAAGATSSILYSPVDLVVIQQQKVRSPSHWFPYDRVGVVDADP
jgi:hypothetical protein